MSFLWHITLCVNITNRLCDFVNNIFSSEATSLSSFAVKATWNLKYNVQIICAIYEIKIWLNESKDFAAKTYLEIREIRKKIFPSFFSSLKLFTLSTFQQQYSFEIHTNFFLYIGRMIVLMTWCRQKNNWKGVFQFW